MSVFVQKLRRPFIILLAIVVVFEYKYGFTTQSLQNTPIGDIKTAQKYISTNLALEARLGNHLFEVVSLFGIARTLGRTPTLWIADDLSREHFEQTSHVFPGLLDKFAVFWTNLTSTHKYAFYPDECCTFVDPKPLENMTDQYVHMFGYYYQSWKYFAGRRDEIISYLKPMQNFGILPKSDENTFVVCVHARQGDFVDVGRYSSEKDFIVKAVQFIKDREKHRKRLTMKTVIFGDNLDFMKDIFPDSVYSDAQFSDLESKTTNFVSANSPSDDLLYSSQHCDSVLISAPVSTFGWWIGYLSKGDRVFYLDVTTVPDALYMSGKLKIEDFYLPKWTALMFSADNSTVIESDN